jgi:hypothetical protein
MLSSSPVQFFRDDSWGNAYVIVAKMSWRTLFKEQAATSANGFRSGQEASPSW